MTMINFDIGSFVQIDGHICLVAIKTKGIAQLSNGHENYQGFRIINMIGLFK